MGITLVFRVIVRILLGRCQAIRRDTGIFFLARASRPSMARSGRRRPVGSRPQKEDTRIPAQRIKS